jgi:hypothetical protein
MLQVHDGSRLAIFEGPRQSFSRHVSNPAQLVLLRRVRLKINDSPPPRPSVSGPSRRPAGIIHEVTRSAQTGAARFRYTMHVSCLRFDHSAGSAILFGMRQTHFRRSTRLWSLKLVRSRRLRGTRLKRVPGKPYGVWRVRGCLLFLKKEAQAATVSALRDSHRGTARCFRRRNLGGSLLAGEMRFHAGMSGA